MSNCTVIQNITTTLQKKGLIDDKFNIIGNTKDVFPYIDKLNEHARTKYGATEDLVLTKPIPSRLGANATVKVRFNHKVGQYIDSIKKMVDFQSRNNEEGNYVESSPINFSLIPEKVQGILAAEKTIRDLAARMSDRIGIPVRFVSDRSKQYKGKIENNVAYVNLAYATLDTPIHEILGHPIIRAIKDRSKNQEDSSFNKLYENLLEELSTTQRGKKVLDRIKRDYIVKNTPEIIEIEPINTELGWGKEYEILGKTFSTKKEALDYQKEQTKYYTLEEQQEEAIVELLGLMTAEKLDNVKDGKLISLLKRLLKEMKQFVRSLINQKEVEIDKLPDNMTLGDIADLLAYSNSKLILPGYEVEYTTPDNNKFKTYQEASNHISELAKSVEDVDLSNVDLPLINKAITNINDIPVNEFYSDMGNLIKKEDNKWVEFTEGGDWVLNDKQVLLEYNNVNELAKDLSDRTGINSFVEKNKEYEQSKEIIEEWKKVNNIQYNPEEIYSRGQEFVSVVGAYSSFDVNLMMQNLLSHIEDNEKAGGKFAISAYTKPIDKQIGHLEGGGGKIKFKLYPQSNDILWAANTDVYSGSVWDASEKVNKDKKSELLGVSYTKYPSLSNVNTVQPNLAAIVDDLNHHHNELGITLTGNNFRLEYDEDIPYQTKKIIDGINKILDQKYGKLVPPEINKEDKNRIEINNLKQQLQQLLDQEEELYATTDFESIDSKSAQNLANKIQDVRNNITILAKDNRNKGIQPTQTKDNLKESIESVKKKLNNLTPEQIKELNDKVENGEITDEEEYNAYIFDNLDKINKKEYTSQALINTKIATLKEVAKKYPRSLIRSEVVLSNKIARENRYQGFEGDDLPFQKIPSTEGNIINEEDESLPEIKDSLENLRLPITDNFGELLTYKKAQLNELNREIKSLSNNKEKNKEILKEKYKDRKKLENQIQELSDPESTILNMYHSVFTELENMQNDINNDRVNFDTFDSRLQFFKRFVHTDDFYIFKVLGEDYNKDIDNKTDQGYNSLLNLVYKVEENFKVAKEKGINKLLMTPKIEQILTGLNTKQVKNSKGELIDNEDYKKSRESLGQDEDYILTIEDLKIVNRDIDYFSTFALGIDDSQSGGGLVLATQMLKNEYVASQNFYSNYVANISEKILELHKKVSDTSFLIKKDSKGQDTLYLNKLFNQSWDEQSKNLQRAFNNFYKQNNHRLRKIEYQKIARELKNTSIVINPAKLPYFKVLMEKHSKYDERYKQYFTYSEQEMLNYENRLKSLLGPLYDTYIKEIEHNIQEFDEHIDDTIHTGGKYVENNIHRNNFWDYSRKLEEFNTNNTSNRMQIGITSTGSEVLFQNYKSLSIIPLDTIEGEKTSFYNEEFREIIKDSNKFELWKNVKELCSFISDTYSDNLDIQETNLMLPWFKESFKSSMANEKNFKNKVVKGTLEGLNEFQNIFKKDTSIDTADESYIRKNYHNEAKVKINKKTSLYQAQGMSRSVALEKATQEVLKDLKKDTLIENIIAAGNLAAQHTSRISTLPQAKLLAIYMQEMNNKMSGNLQKKFSGWFRGHILNTTVVETRTDSLFNKPIGKKKIYTTEEKIYKDKYQRLKENNKLSASNKVQINKVINGKAYDLSYMVNEETNEIHFLVNGESVSLETYQKEYEDYLQSELDSLGVDVNAVGIINGFMKLKILSALGLNPISGNFNRYEGIQTNASIDQTGEYWTPGNDIKSKRFLAGVNTKTLMSIIPSKFVNVEQKKELLKYKKFIEHFASIQDKRNELEKANDKLGFQWEDMVYNFSQGLPEFKNQGQNILSLLQDITIEKDGEIVQFFDGVNLNGIVENSDGSIEIHPDFVSELGDLKSDKMLDLYNKITTVINRIQGNYDKNDQLLIKGSLGGRMAMQMKTWMGAHIIQRYGSMQDKGQLNIDLATGKLRKNGRHVEFLHNHPYLAGLSMLMSMANTKGGSALMMLGGGLAIPVVLTGGLAAWAFVFKGSKANYQANVKHTLNLAIFLREILLQSMNFLPRTLLSKDVLGTLENKSDKLKNRSFNNLTESDIMNMKAIALEMSAQLNMLVLKSIAYVIASSLLGADDEDESSFTNVTHNFIQNQLTRASTSIGNWGSMPIYGVLADSEKVALIQTLEQIINTLNKEDPELSDYTKIGAGIFGIPVILTKMGNGLLPFQDEKNFDVQGKQKDFKWVRDTFFLDAESKAKKEYKKQREEVEDDFRSIVTEEFDNKEDVKVILDGLMEETVGIKDKDLSYEETLELLNENGKLDTKDTREKIVKKLRENGNTDEEIEEKMNKIYSNLNR